MKILKFWNPSDMTTPPTTPTAPRVLLLYRNACNLEGIIRTWAKNADAVFCPTKRRDVNFLPEGHIFNWSQFGRIRENLAKRKYDLVICTAVSDSCWRWNRSPLKNISLLLKMFLKNFPSLGIPLLLPQIRSSGVPLIVLDWEDNTILARKNWPLLEACTWYFKTQCPVNPLKAFLFQDKRNDCVFNISRNNKYKELGAKIRPVSLGLEIPAYLDSCRSPEKKADIFFAGAVYYSWIRIHGKKMLEQLAGEGCIVDLPSEKLDHKTYLKRTSEAWLIWSPEGGEWDNARHYESLLMGSVPVINYPPNWRYRPFEDRKHVLYYDVAGEHLLTVIREALTDKDRLRTIAQAGAEFVRQYHYQSTLASYMVDMGLGREL
ncbi:MAG: glycosyltransferase [Methylacidiphilales bacterium]|nr:glycosyltransferase [Candidatus Methylacidiphilales bacterium]